MAKQIKSTGTSKAEYEAREKEREKKTQAALDALFGAGVKAQELMPDKSKPMAPKTPSQSIKKAEVRTDVIEDQMGSALTPEEKAKLRRKK